MRVHATALLAVSLFAISSAAWADDEVPPVVGGKTYVQHQITAAKAMYPQIASIRVEGKRPEDKSPVVLGSTLSSADVLKPVAHPEGADGEMKAGMRYVIREPFLSSSDHRLGTIEIAFNYAPGQEGKYREIAASVQKRIARNTLSSKNAADPYPYDPDYGPNTYAQTLTEKTIAAHPDLLVMMIHATPPGGKHNLIIGSNIGRFGKIADEDDLRVIEKGSTNLEIGGDDKDRFETELPLNDASGKRIGALGLVFSYRDGQDKEAIHRHGLEIRDEIARGIPTSAALFRRTS